MPERPAPTMMTSKWAFVFESDIHQNIQVGDQLKAYVKNVRSDGKIDLSLQPQGYLKMIDQSSQSVLDILHKNNGHFKYTDKSDPEQIRAIFGMSKKAFKNALGNLYKQKIIRLEKTGTWLVKKG